MSSTDDIRKAGKPHPSLSLVAFSDARIVRQDTHVPRAGRDLIRKTLEDACVPVSVRSSSLFRRVSPLKVLQFLEVQAQHAFIRDESSKGRWDAALTRSLFSFMMEVFERTVGRDLGPKVGGGKGVEHVC
jgi:carboxymethylenebutenolidase